LSFVQNTTASLAITLRRRTNEDGSDLGEASAPTNEVLRISNARISFDPSLRQISFDMHSSAGRIPCALMKDTINAICGPNLDLELCWDQLQRDFNDHVVAAVERKWRTYMGGEIEIHLSDIYFPGGM
jgi:hypothetical protein